MSRATISDQKYIGGQPLRLEILQGQAGRSPACQFRQNVLFIQDASRASELAEIVRQQAGNVFGVLAHNGIEQLFFEVS